ncbi:MAG: tRNA lysidine(34) synthetase TilS [Rhodospirillaceae bacterium]
MPLGGGIAEVRARFDAAMAGFGGFESRPLLAVGVSGGADSLALLRLADAWCRERGGSVLAITVDHRLRPESAAEAARLGGWLAGLDIPHRILVWEGEKPETGIEAAARHARHAALEAVCRAAGALHLLLAHHAGDQRETVTMRAARGPGPGEAGMAALDARRDVRVLRPLLGCEKAELEGLCRALSQPWIEDPSNASDAFERNRVRKRLAALPQEKLAALDAAIAAAQARRAAAEAATAARVQAWARLSPLGFAWVDAAAWRAAPRDAAADRGFLAALLRCIGGGGYAPPRLALDRACETLLAGQGATLAGCVLRPGGGGLWVLRECRSAPPPHCAAGLWDGRFSVAAEWQGRLRYPRDAAERQAVLAAFSAFGPGEAPPSCAVAARIPVADAADGVCVPGLLGYDPGVPPVRFRPPHGVSACTVWLAPPGARLMY